MCFNELALFAQMGVERTARAAKPKVLRPWRMGPPKFAALPMAGSVCRRRDKEEWNERDDERIRRVNSRRRTNVQRIVIA